MPKYHQGYYKPFHPEKYRGDPTMIIYRSSWEYRFCKFLDTHRDIVQWASEEFFVPYRSPISGRIRRYFPDFWLKKTDGIISVVEIKPFHQTMEPKVKKKVTKKYLNEVKTWGTNQAKWKAAEEYCLDRGWQFMIVTEKDMGLEYK